MFVVTLAKNGTTFGLKGTTWALSFERATQHETQEAALAAFAKAKKFMKPMQVRAVQVKEYTPEQFAAICAGQDARDIANSKG